MSTSSKSIPLPPTMCLKRHHHNSNNKQKLVVIHGSNISLVSTEEDDDNNSIITSFSDPGFGVAVASCHGLLLTVMNQYHDEKLALWDPSTKDFFIKTLPQPPRPPPSVEYDWMNQLFGLGLAGAPDDYKVIRYLDLDYAFVDDEDVVDYTQSSCFMGCHLAELYSLKTDSWKRIPFPHVYKACPVRDCLPGYPVHINGCSYWTAYSGPLGENLVIISFDFANETFPPLIPGPGGYKLFKQYRFLVAEFEGSLALVVHLFEDKLFELWVWNHEEDSWSRIGAWAISDAKYPLALLKNHLLFFQDFMGELGLFDCAKQKSKKVGLCGTKISMRTLRW